VAEVIYSLEPRSLPVAVGQSLEVFIEATPRAAARRQGALAEGLAPVTPLSALASTAR
jgi:hypothetical protein